MHRALAPLGFVMARYLAGRPVEDLAANWKERRGSFSSKTSTRHFVDRYEVWPGNNRDRTVPSKTAVWEFELSSEGGAEQFRIYVVKNFISVKTSVELMMLADAQPIVSRIYCRRSLVNWSRCWVRAAVLRSRSCCLADSGSWSRCWVRAAVLRSRSCCLCWSVDWSRCCIRAAVLRSRSRCRSVSVSRLRCIARLAVFLTLSASKSSAVHSRFRLSLSRCFCRRLFCVSLRRSLFSSGDRRILRVSLRLSLGSCGTVLVLRCLSRRLLCVSLRHSLFSSGDLVATLLLFAGGAWDAEASCSCCLHSCSTVSSSASETGVDTTSPCFGMFQNSSSWSFETPNNYDC